MTFSPSQGPLIPNQHATSPGSTLNVALGTFTPGEMEFRRRQDKLNKRWRYLYGDMTRPIRGKRGVPSDNVLINKVKPLVNKGVSFLFGNPVKFQVVTKTGKPNPKAQKALDGFWAKNRQDSFLILLGINGGVCGHAFIQMVPEGKKKPPRLVILNPIIVDVHYRADDVDTVDCYTIQYDTTDPRTGLAYTYRKRILRGGTVLPDSDNHSLPDPATVPNFAENGITPAITSTGAYGGPGGATGYMEDTQLPDSADELDDPDETRWTIIEETRLSNSSIWNEFQTTEWDYSWPPIGGCQNLPHPNQYWGMADVEEDVLALNDATNSLMSDAKKIVRIHGSARFYAHGIEANQIKFAPDEMMLLPPADGTVKLGMIEMNANGLNAIINVYHEVNQAIHEAAQVPEIATGNVGNLTQISGLALQIMYEPLLQKTKLKRGEYGPFLEEISRRALDFMGFGADNVVHIVWPEMLPVDPAAQRQALGTDKQMGVASAKTVADKLGYDYDEESKNIDRERDHELEFQKKQMAAQQQHDLQGEQSKAAIQLHTQAHATAQQAHAQMAIQQGLLPQPPAEPGKVPETGPIKPPEIPTAAPPQPPLMHPAAIPAGLPGSSNPLPEPVPGAPSGPEGAPAPAATAGPAPRRPTGGQA